ncbi:MAG: ABC transporter substrate-binding protein [Oceanospirillaceae bacterium]|nr:ABC transporter substrate-binding protein [Oceanospirillaceae bacterium]
MKINVIWLFLCTSLMPALVLGAPQSIVSADGSLTEIVYALQQQHRLVGVDTTSKYPAQAATLPQIGYKRNISAEGVLSLAPQVLIATEDSGPDIILKQIAEAGVTIERYSAKPGLAVVREKIQGLAKLLEVEAAGDALWQQVSTDVARARAKLSQVKEPVKVMFVLSTAGGSVLASGADTMADAIIGLAGGVNAISAFTGYKPISVEAIVSAAPDVILMMARGGDHGGGEDLLAREGFKLTPAAINNRLVKMDGMLMLGFGPRIGEAINRLVADFYPRLDVAATVQ